MTFSPEMLLARHELPRQTVSILKKGTGTIFAFAKKLSVPFFHIPRNPGLHKLFCYCVAYQNIRE